MPPDIGKDKLAPKGGRNLQKKKKKPITGLVAFAITVCMGATGLAVSLPAVLSPGNSTSAEALAGATEVADRNRKNLFGAVQTNVNSDTSELMLIPGGQAFGVKFYTDGVMVVDMTAFETADGMRNPAYEAGIRTKDIIISVNGEKITSNRDISKIVSACNGKQVVFEVKRNDTTFTVNVSPQKSAAQDSYKVGLWVRDSTAGIGTITYFNPQTGHFAGLGHGISDVDTGVLMPLAAGDVIGANISSVIKGQKGAPGQLEGSFNEFVQYGSLLQNTSQGVFGKTEDRNLLSQQAIPIASNEQVEVGEVTIRCTTNGTQVSEYKAMIESINKSSSSQGKNMVIKITDEALLEKTGGIVQGMSGSPIIQNGKLVGAVTHVLINDPTMGYGIFIENMLAIDSQNAA